MKNLLQRITPGAIERRPETDDASKSFRVEKELTERRREIMNSISVIRLESTATPADDAATAVEAGERAMTAETQVRAVESAIAITRLRRVAAIVKRRQTEAEQLRARAKELSSQAAAILRKSAGLLADLSRLQEVPYDARVLSRQPCTVSTFADNYRPLSVELEFQAQTLIDRADALDRSQVVSSGSATGHRAQVIASEQFGDPERLTPARHEVEAWLEALEVKIRNRFGASNNPRQYRLTWKDGRICHDASWVEIDDGNYGAHARPTFSVAA